MSLVIVRVLIKINHVFKFQGTAFFINEHTLITAKHVLQKALKMGYEIWLSDIPNGGKLLISKENIEFCERDIAILKTKKKFEIEEVLFNNLELEKKVKIKGYHNENGTISSSFHPVSGYVNYEHTYELQHHSTNGFSGSPIIYNDKVCGVATAIHRKDNITFVIPISECHEQLKNYKITVKKIYPFIGLKAFTQENSQFFFGRNEEIKLLLHKLEKENIIAIVGDSGSGKSSFVQAGLIPAYLGQNSHKNSEISFETIQIRPAENPFDELRAAIAKRCHALRFSPIDRDYYKNQIEINNFKAIRGVFEELFNIEQVSLLFYIDQFEELFTLSKESYQEPFIELLLYLHNNQLSKLKIQTIFTMRTDAYHFEDKYQMFVHLIDENKYRLKLMKDKALEDCVVEPLFLGGIDKQKAKEFSDDILDDMDENQDSSLTLLQIALTQTWQHKKEDNTLMDAYKKAGKITGALDKLATDTMTSLVTDNEPMFESIFMRLMKFGDHSTKIRRRRLADKEEFSSQEWEVVKKLASLLDANGKVTTSPDSKGGRLLVIHGKEVENKKDVKQMVELVHESLMTQWTVYKKWINNVSNQVNLKRFHEIVIEKTKEHKRKEASLLMGSDLDKGLMLLDSEYRRFLSDGEVAYVEGSLRKRKKSKWVKAFIFIILGVALFAVYYESNREKWEFQNKLEKYKSVENIEKKVFFLREGLLYAHKLIQKKNLEDALVVYTQLLKNFDKIDDLLIVSYMSIILYNKGVLLEDLTRIEEAKLAFRRIVDKYHNSENQDALIHLAKAYGHLSWYELVKKNYPKSIEFAQKGRNIKKNDFIIDVSLAHAYLLVNKFEEAKIIYLIYKHRKEDIIKDFRSLENHGIRTKYFKKIEFLLKNK